MVVFLLSLACHVKDVSTSNETGDSAVPPCVPTTETCDGVDDDCDHLVDDHDPDLVASTWYRDSDGDRFGDPSSPEVACDQPADAVVDSTDCDDTREAANPDAHELCNGFDDDCDGLVDGQDDTLTGGSIWYTDADGDGYGDPTAPQSACSAPPGTVTDHTDLDDTDPSVHGPSAGPFVPSPAPWALAVDPLADVTVTCACDVDAATISEATFEVYGEVSGFLRGTLDVSGHIVRFVPDAPARAGERVTAVLTTGVRCQDGTAAGAGTWTWMADVSGGTGDLDLQTSGGSSANTWKIVPVDLDGDGLLELVVSDRVAADLEVYAPTSGMGLLQTIAVSSDPIRIRGADVDHDYDSDIVVAANGGDVVETLLNDGTGVLSRAPGATPVGAGPVSITTGDVDLDGDLDAVIASQVAGSWSVLLNDGSGEFAVATETPTDAIDPVELLLADVDGDYDLDVVVFTLTSATIEVYRNDGSGAMPLAWVRTVGSTPLAAWAADLDGDGTGDLAVGTQYGGELDILVGAGTGAFLSSQLVTTDGILDICGADLNADGDVDLAFGEHDSSALRTLENDGYGRFSMWLTTSLDQTVTGVACADVDGDGAVDVVMSEEYVGSVLYFHNPS